MKATFQKYRLDFKFDAGTSRGVLKHKDTWLLKITDLIDVSGIGECGPLKGLSIDDREDFEIYLSSVCTKLTKYDVPDSANAIFQLVRELVDENFPSIRFGLETALLDLLNGGEGKLFKNKFVTGEQEIPINGLIWMGSREFMKMQIEDKLTAGYSCLKMKISALNFEEEYKILQSIRSRYPVKDLILRVDANGAFSPQEATEILKRLNMLQIHSIEQPIAVKQWESMAALVQTGLLPIALDEELIGIHDLKSKKELLQVIQPPYIILKPTLLGGLQACMEWIELAEKRNIGWWITSALESNIGLNAIAQFTAGYNIDIHQGLGTGMLYTNNVASKLRINNGFLYRSDEPISF